MKRIVESNYLGGTLEINVYSDRKFVEGYLVFGDFEYYAQADCRDEDKFSEAKGIKLVKMKLASKYHKDELAIHKAMLKVYSQVAKKMEEKVNYHNTKLSNLQSSISKEFGNTFTQGKPKKVVKKKKK